ncbi:hypothetical protein M2152_000380 [Microbacteriaceae bacterium SG_E_30_P1]|uniref:Uncharacterized protein n=1 Tax=Antiquaquibacter oligotrophicus TaxID=2880260 RepID=A0ABT6KJM3_9MICO|nr:hypothetical protein [Antiquaquibacter oligotrophicus]
MPPTLSTLRIEDAGQTVGFIERAGDIYVALRGARYSRAVEVAQTRSFEQARGALLGSAQAS